MRVELKEFQTGAVATLANRLQLMRRRYEQDGELSSVCLASPTGSGKTVMCAATIEALFFGDDDLGLVPDENAVVLWLSDSPSLNEQTSVRFSNVADKLADNILDRRHLVTVTNDFGASHEMLEPRRVYFLSKDLLSRNGLLTKGGEANSGRVFWDILDRTIRDPERNLYLFIDEAHRGLGPTPRASAAPRRSTPTSSTAWTAARRCPSSSGSPPRRRGSKPPWTSASTVYACRRSP